MRFVFFVMASALALASVGCNQRSPLLDEPAIPTSPTSTVTPPPPIATAVTFSRGVVNAGASIQGSVLLTGPAPESGVSVSLEASDNVAQLNSPLTVPAGASRVDFMVATTVVPNDREVRITASTANRSAIGAFQVWADLPEFFQWVSEPGDYIGGGSFKRFTRASAAFTATCNRNTLNIQLQAQGPEHWSAMFSGPAGVPLRPGAYEGATRAPFNTATPGLSIFGAGRGCNTLGGRFVIHDIDLQNDRVNRFHASYVQRCDGSTGLLTGEIRLANMPPSSSAVSCQR